MNEKTQNRRVKIVMTLIGLAALAGAVFLFLSPQNIDVIREIFKKGTTGEERRALFRDFGWRAVASFAFLSMLEVIFPFIPAEPVQILAGLSYGFGYGFLICLAGVFIGNTLLYMLYGLFGEKIRAFFTKNIDIDLDSLKGSGLVAFAIFVLYFLPAIPYGLIAFFAVALGMKFPRYIFLTTAGAIPSILIGVGLGQLTYSANWIVSVASFALLSVGIAFLYIKRHALCKRFNGFLADLRSCRVKAVKKQNPFIASCVYLVVWIIVKCKVKLTREIRCEKIKGPAVIVANHGSFIDFAYILVAFRKRQIHFVTNRMYFQNPILRFLMVRSGAIPKNMFAPDFECGKNIIRVLRAGEIVALFPEARLSVGGKYDGIQPSTYAALQHMNVNVYVAKIEGDYLAGPKWGKCKRKGAPVRVIVDRFATAEEAREMPLETFTARLNAAMEYDELKTLSLHPEIHYTYKRLAEGLENILFLCPECRKKGTMMAKGREVYCESCGYHVHLNDRYAFDNGKFENFTAWYEWESAELKREIVSDPDFALVEKVKFSHLSRGKMSLIRPAGEGICSLSREGFRYVGTDDGKEVDVKIPFTDFYRILFGSGVDFEFYTSGDLLNFAPFDAVERKTAVMWYIASTVLRGIVLPEEEGEKSQP